MPLTRRRLLGAAGLVCVAASAGAQFRSQPLRFAHVYGESVLAQPARRVVSLGFSAHDALLALGVAPLAVRYWYGNHKYGVWPWAAPLLGDAQPVTLRGEVSAEIIAGLQPDLIVGLGSGITRAEYALLSRIAPVLMHEPQYGPYETPWQEGVHTLGRALGREIQAQALVDDVDQQLREVRARNPGWQQMTAVAAYHLAGQTGVFTPIDSRSKFLQQLGFKLGEGLSKIRAIDGFYAPLSPEDLSPIDADLVLWISTWDDNPDLANLPMRRTLRAHREGREVFSDHLLSGALSFSSPLSIPYLLTRMEPLLQAAVDGDPGTIVDSSQMAGLTP